MAKNHNLNPEDSLAKLGENAKNHNYFTFESLLFKNLPTPASFLFISVFSNKQFNLTTNQSEKMSKYQSSLRRRDLNPRPYDTHNH